MFQSRTKVMYLPKVKPRLWGFHWKRALIPKKVFWKSPGTLKIIISRSLMIKLIGLVKFVIFLQSSKNWQSFEIPLISAWTSPKKKSKSVRSVFPSVKFLKKDTAF